MTKPRIKTANAIDVHVGGRLRMRREMALPHHSMTSSHPRSGGIMRVMHLRQSGDPFPGATWTSHSAAPLELPNLEPSAVLGLCRCVPHGVQFLVILFPAYAWQRDQLTISRSHQTAKRHRLDHIQASAIINVQYLSYDVSMPGITNINMSTPSRCTHSYRGLIPDFLRSRSVACTLRNSAANRTVGCGSF
jgi:hypothetical protein